MGSINNGAVKHANLLTLVFLVVQHLASYKRTNQINHRENSVY